MAKYEWREALPGPMFQARLENCLRYPDVAHTIKAKTFAMGCLKCSGCVKIEPCSNCGGVDYLLGFDPDQHVGLFCKSCKLGFTSHKCPSCGCVNPVSDETLLEWQKKGCLVATAACGDSNCEEVRFLTSFRDDVLDASLAGRSFVRLYYLLSPSLASAIRQSNAARLAVRLLLIGPVVMILKRLIRENQ